MKTINDYNGTEGIDKLIECVPYINELIGDLALINQLKDRSWLSIGGEVYKKHTEACTNLFKILDHEPENVVSAVAATAQIMSELLNNKELLDFFMSLGKTLK